MGRERIGWPIYAHSKTHEFLKATIADGAVEPTAREVGPRDFNIHGTYFISRATYQDIAERCPDFNSGERSRQIVKRVFSILHSHCTEETQERFPLHELKIRKYRLQKRTYRISQLLREGEDVRGIKTRLGLSNKQLAGARKSLKNIGLELPYLIHSWHKLESVLGSPSSNDEQIQEALNHASFSFQSKYTSGENPILTSVSEVAKMAGYYFSSKKTSVFVESLKNAKIPRRSMQRQLKYREQEGHLVNYHFIAAQHSERAAMAFKEDESLARFRKNPVNQICGSRRKESPTTHELQNKKGYSAPVHIFRELGIAVGGRSKHTYKDFFNQDCPVAVFKIHQIHFYPYYQERALKTYIREKAEELGLI